MKLYIMWHWERSLIHSEQTKKDLMEIVLKLTEIMMILCTVYERRPITQYCAHVLPACCLLQHGYNGNPVLRRFLIFN